ncbi:M56 family metallopeptidase [Salinimicrobium sp. CAU 1759]
MLQYILETIAFQLIFLLVYELFLKKETFFTYNRAYLLLTPVLALLLPLLKIPALQAAIPAETFVTLPEVFLGAGSAEATSQSFAGTNAEVPQAINWWLLVYGGGFLFSLGFFFNKFRILRQLFAHKPVVKTAEMKIVEVPNSRIACTFYNTIFLGAQLSAKEREQILSHELVHLKQKHTLDLLFFEVLRIVFWFNPLIYIYQSRISALHEYLADAGVVKNVKKQEYFQQLLNSAFNTEDISFINQFFSHSIIKKRIVMLQKNRSKSTSKFKFLILLPLMLAMMVYVSCSTAKGQEKSAAQSEVSSVAAPEANDSGEQIIDYPFAVVEQVPVFPGCEDLATHEEQKECFSQGINNFINTNFNTSLGKKLGLEGLTRVYVRFKVSADGEVTDVEARAPHQDLAEEAKRVLYSLPKMEPAMHDGKKVAVLYTVPINFMVPKNTSEKGDSDN